MFNLRLLQSALHVSHDTVVCVVVRLNYQFEAAHLRLASARFFAAEVKFETGMFTLLNYKQKNVFARKKLTEVKEVISGQIRLYLFY